MRSVAVRNKPATVRNWTPGLQAADDSRDRFSHQVLSIPATKSRKAAFALLALPLTVVLYAEPLPLMPMPSKVTLGDGKLQIDGSFSVRITGHTDQRLELAVARLIARVSRQTGIPINAGPGAVLTIECRAAAPDYPALSEDESYQLDVARESARLSAPTTTGALRGIETFLQLIQSDADSFAVPVMHIEDQPRFQWRGLSLDVARHWMPVEMIERNLDAMAGVKLNVLHWHLSDDQGFRVESKLFPKLQQLGSDGNFYSQADVRHTVAYARDRGIRVVPEFDVPTHATSWLVGYPELASAPGPYAIERKWGIFEPLMDPSREEVFTFLDAFFGEMAGLFPDQYFHIGGDELVDTQWKQNPVIQAFAAAKGLHSSTELHGYFNNRIQAILEKHGKQMIGWDEVLQPGTASSVVIQSWRGQKALADAVRQGHRSILSFGYYLDHLQPASFHYEIDPLGNEAAALSPGEATRVLGGEACMWTEYVTEETVDSRIWPRLAAIAERLWSPAETRDIGSMYHRLEAVSRWLVWTGVKHRANHLEMLQRIAGGSSPALTRLADVLEPQGIDQRQAARQYTSRVPLNRLVDAVPPESESVRGLDEGVATLIRIPGQHPREVSELRLTFTEWSLNDERLRPLISTRFLLREASGLSEDLSRIGKIGLESLQYLESGNRPPADWLAEQKQELDRMEKPQAEVVLAAVRPVRALLASFSTRPAQAASPADQR
jgi:hexosaminidase